KSLRFKFSIIKKYRYRWVLIIALVWTLIDVSSWVRYMQQPYELRSDSVYSFLTPGAVLLRAVIDFVMSLFMANLLVFRLRNMFRNFPLFISFIGKTLILVVASFFMNFLVHVSYSLFTLHLSL